MQCVWAVFAEEDRTVSPELCARLESAAAPAGWRGRRSWSEGSVGIGAAAPGEEPADIAVLGRLRLAGDVRLDNREELARELDTPLPVSAALDGELLLRAYRRWGADCCIRLLGDFAFLLWDGEARRLLAARDPLGQRLLHYGRAAGRLVVASRPGAVREGLGGAELNRDLLREALQRRYSRWTEETIFRGVRRLLPGHRLTASPGRSPRVERYRALGEGGGERYRRDEEYGDRLRELLASAVEARTAGVGRVGVLTSGGLDSASVAVLAERAIAAGSAGRRLFLYSGAFERSPGAETRAHQERVFRACPSATPRTVVGDGWWALRETAETAAPLDEPALEYSEEALAPLLARARADGCRVVLTGHGADQVLCSHSYPRPWMLDDVRLADLPREVVRFVRSAGAARSPLVGAAVALRFLPRRWAADLFRSAWLLRSGVGDPRLAGSALPGHPAALTVCSLVEGLGAARAAALEYQAWRAGVELRHPFLDRRVVDFLVHLPRGLRFRDGIRKWILRQAVAGLVPEPVRTRDDLAHFGRLLSRGLRETENGRLASWMLDAEVSRRRLLTPADLRARWRRHLGGDVEEPVARPMVVLAYVERWLRQSHETLHAGQLLATSVSER